MKRKPFPLLQKYFILPEFNCFDGEHAFSPRQSNSWFFALFIFFCTSQIPISSLKDEFHNCVTCGLTCLVDLSGKISRNSLFCFIFLLRNEQYRHGHYGAIRQELTQAHELKYTSNFDLKDISNFNEVCFTLKSCSVFLLGINYPRKKIPYTKSNSVILVSFCIPSFFLIICCK